MKQLEHDLGEETAVGPVGKGKGTGAEARPACRAPALTSIMIRPMMYHSSLVECFSLQRWAQAKVEVGEAEAGREGRAKWRSSLRAAGHMHQSAQDQRHTEGKAQRRRTLK